MKLDVPYKTSEKDEKYPGFREQSFEWAAKWKGDKVIRQVNLKNHVTVTIKKAYDGLYDFETGMWMEGPDYLRDIVKKYH